MKYGCLIVVALSLVGCNRQQAVQANQTAAPIQVKVARVSAKQISRNVEAIGTLFPFEEVTISSEIEGRTLDVTVDLGDRVQKDQVIVSVVDEEQRYLLAQNEAQLRQALERLGLKNENDKVGDIKETPEVRRAAADLFDAEQKFRRMRDLVTQGIGSRQDGDAAQAKYQAAQADYETMLNTSRNLIQDVARFRGAVDLQRKKLRDTTIRSPFPAEVKERLVNVGTYLRVGTPVFTLVKTDPIRLRMEVPERMAPWVKTGQTAGVRVEAFPDRDFQGRIWRISPTVDQSKRTFVVEALIDNGKNELKAGSYAKATVRTSKVDSIHLVPAIAVNYVFGANKVYVVGAGKVEVRDVKLGDRFGDALEISQGVKEGEEVATSQLMKLDTGSKVQVIEN
jgi:RND family efflux transporter MFP subunit